MQEISQKLASLAKESQELRNAAGESSINETIEDLHTRLITLRKAQDRSETIVLQVAAIRSAYRAQLNEAQDAYDDAWRTAAMNNRVGEYESAKAQDARFAASSIEQLIKLRAAKKEEAAASDVYNFVYTRHKGLNDSRKDLDTRIRMLSVAGYLES